MSQPPLFPSGRRKVIGSAIRTIACPWNSSTVAAGHFEGNVEVWDLNSQKRISKFDTPLEFGGERLKISPDGAKVFAASHGAAGIACFESTTGNLLWQRKDLREIQIVGVAFSGSAVHCGFDRKPLEILNPSDGATLERLRAVRDCHYSPFSEARLLEKRKLELHRADGEKPIGIDRETFGVLSTAFSQETFVVSESTGPLRCFNLGDGSLRWRYAPLEGPHVLHLGYQLKSRNFVGVQWRYSVGGMCELLLFNEAAGEVTARFPMERSSDYCFAREGSRLISSDGWIVNTEDCSLVGSFDFPTTEYFA